MDQSIVVQDPTSAACSVEHWKLVPAVAPGQWNRIVQSLSGRQKHVHDDWWRGYRKKNDQNCLSRHLDIITFVGRRPPISTYQWLFTGFGVILTYAGVITSDCPTIQITASTDNAVQQFFADWFSHLFLFIGSLRKSFFCTFKFSYNILRTVSLLMFFTRQTTPPIPRHWPDVILKLLCKNLEAGTASPIQTHAFSIYSRLCTPPAIFVGFPRFFR